MIDYEYWDSISEFTINEAAWLWIGEEPKIGHEARTAKYLRTSNLIYEATQNGSLKYRETKKELFDGIYADGETYVIRVDLKHFALCIGHKPKFLFPEMRLNQDPIQNKYAVTNLEEGRPDDRINSLLKIVLGMAIDAYKYDPDAQKNKATGGKSGSIAVALEKIPGLKTDPDTIRNYLTEASRRFPSAKPNKS